MGEILFFLKGVGMIWKRERRKRMTMNKNETILKVVPLHRRGGGEGRIRRRVRVRRSRRIRRRG